MKRIWEFLQLLCNLKLFQNTYATYSYSYLFIYLAMLHSLWDPSSPTRDRTWVPAVKAPSPNHWTTREFPYRFIFKINIKTYVHTKVCAQIFLAALSIILKKWKQSKYPLTGMDRQNIVYLYNEIVFGNKKEVGVDTCYNVDEPRKYCVRWKQPVTKDHKL